MHVNIDYYIFRVNAQLCFDLQCGLLYFSGWVYINSTPITHKPITTLENIKKISLEVAVIQLQVNENFWII